MLSDFFDLLNGKIEVIDFIVSVGAMLFVVFCATPLHEFAHALIAVKLGDDTPLVRGRLTINPLAHIDPIGTVMIFLFGFGYAKPVEVRMRKFKKPKRDMALVALAGPVCNILQGVVFVFLFNLFVFISSKTGIQPLMYVSGFFFIAANININLAVFNLLPVPPLDGSRLLTALLPSNIYFKIMQYERYISIALMVLIFTGILTKPLGILSSIVMTAIEIVTGLPFILI